MLRARLTPLGKILLTLMLLFYAASVTSQSGLLLLFIGLMAGCFAVNWSFARRNVRAAQVVPPRITTVVEGGKSREPWRIVNSSRKHIELLEIESPFGPLFRVPMLRVGANATVLPQITFPRRGVFPHSTVIVTSAAPFGLVRVSRPLEAAGETVVVPRIYEAEAPAAAGVDHISGGRHRGRRRVSNGAHFAGIRSWQQGDGLRQVHWQSTARRGELMVKTFEEELGGRVTVLLDCELAPADLVDGAVRAAGSLAAAALQAGHHVELCDGATDPLRLAPFSDESELLDRLARFEPGAATPDCTAFWRKSTLIVIGTAWRAEWPGLVAEAEAQRRHVVIYLPESAQVPVQDAFPVSHFSADCLEPEHSPVPL